MTPEELRKWYASQLKQGFSKEQASEMMMELGYSNKQVSQIEECFPDEKKPQEVVVPPKKSFDFRLLLIPLVIMLLIAGAAFVFIDQPEPVVTPDLEDGVSPDVIAGVNGKWQVYSGVLGINCSDDGKEFVSGCDLSTVRFALVKNNCPEKYSGYEAETAREIPKGMAVCVAILDKEGNLGKYGPVRVNV